ncbi:4Fe-4S dicluster domain-containing protein [Planctomycetota bacterium]
MSISRRKFLRGMAGLGAGAGLAASAAPAAKAVEVFSGYPDRYGVLVDLTHCVGCRSCEAACYAENRDQDSNRRVANSYPDNLAKPTASFEDMSVFAKTRRTGSDSYTVVNRYDQHYRKTQCFHCNEPACASACLVGAFKKTPEGAVIYDASVCIGCRYCITACPFNIPTYEYEKAFTPRVQKCTLCYHRISAGKLPACVEACPFEVMTFGRRADLATLAKKKITRHPDRYVHHLYGEHEAGGTSWMYLSPVPFGGLGFPTNLPMMAVGEYTRGALSVVPAVILFWPTLLAGLFAMTRRKEQIAANTARAAAERAAAKAKAEAEVVAEKKLKRALKDAEREKKTAIKKALEEAKQAEAAKEDSR